ITRAWRRSALFSGGRLGEAFLGAVDGGELRGDLRARHLDDRARARLRRERDHQPVGAGPHQRLGQGGGELFGVRAASAGIAGDFVAADRDKAQRLTALVRGGRPLALLSDIAVFDVELVGGLARARVEIAAQAVEIGARNSKERRIVLDLRADKAEKLAVLLLGYRDGAFRVRTGRSAGYARPLNPGAGREPGEEDGGDQGAGRAKHRHHPSMAALSSPSVGARLVNSGRDPSNESGMPTSARSLPGWLWIR